jgi:signal transduction histidine kinase
MIEQPRRWPFRIGQAAALLVMAGLGLFDLAAIVNDVTWPLRVALALATAALWFPAHRHRSQLLPILAGVLGAASFVVTGVVVVMFGAEGESWGLAESAGIMLVLVVVARRGATPLAIPAAVVLVLALAAQPLRTGLSVPFFAGGLFQALLGLAAASTGAYQRYTDAARQQQMLVARADQRAEFARDLHDFVAHHVTGIVVQAQGARYVAEQDPKRVAAALEQIEHAGAEAMTAMRRMVAMLRQPGTDAPLAPLAGLGDLPALTAGFSAAGGPPVQLRLHGALDQLPMEATTSAYRVVMEALTNVRQHAAGATRVEVFVQRTPDWLMVRVVDDGTPPHRAAVRRERPGYGLVGLAERVTALGGWLRAGPAIGHGWAVDARIPLRGAA